MDKQTAIELLDNLLGMVEDNHDSDYDTAIHMGIDALKSNTSNVLSALDCIERQATIDALCDNCDTVDAVCAHIPCKRYISIENLPSVQTDMSGNMSVTNISLDCISRQAAIDALGEEPEVWTGKDEYAQGLNNQWHYDRNAIMALPSAQTEHTETHSCVDNRTETHESCTDCPLYDHDRHNCPRFNRVIPATIEAAKPRWIPVTEALPEDLEAVNITWVNHEPEPYYHDIKDKNFVATGIHYRDKWYWYSTTCADFLGEYGSNEVEEVDDAVEIIAWMPLPEPYKEEE